MKSKFYSMLTRSLSVRILILGLTFSVMCITTLKAQNVSTYSFTQQIESTTDINLLGTLVGSNADDNNYALVAIPFTFTYHGVGFTTVGISANCYMKLGATTTTSYTPLTSQVNCIAVQGADMYGLAAGNRIEYRTEGVSPNRVFRVQWTNWGKYSSGLNEITAQIALFEGTNVIKISYLAAPGNTAYTCQVGLTGAAVSDFNDRTTTTNWSATTAGVANSATMTHNSSVKPAANLVYTWTPPVACSGTPLAGTISGPSSACAATSFTVNSSGITVGSGIQYQWQVSTAGCGGPFTNISGQTTATLTTTQSVASSYQLVTTCTNSGLTNTSNCISIGMNSPTNCYCTSNATSTADEEISNVQFGSLNNTSACGVTACGPGSIAYMYSNFTTCVSAPSVGQNSLVPFSVTQTSCGGQFGNKLNIYIDYNQNGLFTDAGELVWNGPYLTGNHTDAGTITIPSTATLGNTRMRVVCVESSVVNPCGTYTWGETEDYLVNITAPCAPPPVAISPSSPSICTGGSGVTLTASGATSYTWAPSTGLNNTVGATVTANPGATTTYTVTGTLGGCAATATVTVTVNGSPTFSGGVTATPSSVCLSGNSQLDGTATLSTTLTYSQAFVSGVTPTTQATAWTSFLASLPSTGITSVTMSGSNDPTGVTIADPTTAQNIANALRTSATTTYTFGSQTWRTGICGGGQELTNTASICGCNTGYTLRPTIGNLNWGGINGVTCSAPSQTMTLTFVVGTPGSITYSWSPTTFLNDPTLPNPLATGVTSTTTYTVTASSGSCNSTGTVTVSTGGTLTGTATATPPPVSGNYTVSSIAYAPVSGSPIAGPAGDDAVGGPYALPFAFNFYGTSYTQVYISTNGFISFTGDFNAGCCAGQALPNTATPNNLIAACWTDLNTGVSGNIDYFSLTSPNRFVVRYNNVGHFSGSPQVTSEIILYQTGEIEIHNNSINAQGTMTQGIENSSGTLGTPVTGRNAGSWSATNDAYRFTPPNSSGPACPGGTWTLNATVSGGGAPYTYLWTGPNLNSSSTASVTAVPLSSATYSVTITDACGSSTTSSVFANVADVNGTISSTSPSICAGQSSTLTMSGNASTFSWSPGAGLNTTSGNTVIASPTTTTIYTCTASSGACSATASTTVNVIPAPNIGSVTASPTSVCLGGSSQLTANVATAPPSGYCSPTLYPSNPCNYLNMVSTSGGLTNFNNSNSGYNGTGYTFFPSMVVSQNLGGTFTLTCQAQGTCNIVYYNIWIDWNQNGSFENSEQVVIANGVNSGNTLTNFTITVPMSATPGTTRIRILGDGNSINPVTACDNFSSNYSEVEDYVLNIPGGGGLTYSWSPTTFLNDPTISNPLATGVTSTTTYVVTVTNSTGCSSTATTTVNLGGTLGTTATATAPPGLPPPSPYCIPGYSYGCGFPDVITNVSFSTINNNTGLACGQGSNLGYDPVFTTPNPVLNGGSTYALSVTTGGDVEGAAVWIDYNQNGVFDNSEQLVHGFNGTNPATYSASVLIPSTAYNGQTRMRVRCTYSADPNNNPCGSVTYGETEDYYVTIANATPVPQGDCPGMTWTLSATPTGGGLPYTYLWTGPGLNSNNSATVTAVPPGGTTSYSVLVTDACGNTATQTVNTVVQDLTAIAVTPASPTICQGASTSLSATGASTYSWAPATGLNSTTGSTVNASPSTTTTYTVTGVSGSCSLTSTVTVTVDPAPAISATASPTLVCTGGSSSLNGQATSSSTVTFTGNFTSGIPADAATCNAWVSFCNSLTAGNYTSVNIKGTFDMVGRTASNPANAQAIANALRNRTTLSLVDGGNTWVVGIGCGSACATNQAELSADGSACSCLSPGYTVRPSIGNLNWGGVNTATCGGPSQTIIVTFTVPGGPVSGVTYSWSPTTFLNDATSPTPTASNVTSSTTYTVTATSDIGCSATSTVTVNVGAPLTSASVASPNNICAGGSSNITATPSGGVGPFSYAWSNGGSTQSISVAPGSTTTYDCIITDFCGNTSSSSATVTVNPSPVAGTASGPSFSCQNSPVTGVTVSGGVGSFIWQVNINSAGWNDIVGQTSSTLTYTPTTTGNYQFRARFIGFTPCVDVFTNPVSMSVTNGPSATASASPTHGCPGDVFNLSATGNLVVSGDYSVSSIAYAPVSPSGSPIAGPSGDDVMGGPYALPFSFTYYGVSYSNVYISTNGFIAFANSGALCCSGAFLPASFDPYPIIAGCWTDLYAFSPGIIDYFSLSSPNRFVVRWTDVGHCCSSSPGQYSGEIILYQTGEIEMHTTSATAVGTMTQGIQNANGTLATVVSGRNSSTWSASNDAFRFTPPSAPGLTYSWSASPSGTINSPSSQNTTAIPFVNTTYTVAVSGGGCTTTATTTVTMDAAAVTASATPSSICINGSSVSLSSNFSPSAYVSFSGVGVVNISGNWYFDPTTPGVVVGNNAVTCTYTPPVGCSGSTTFNVNVLPLPNATASVIGINPRCRDLATGLVATGGGTYSWTGPLGFTSTVATPIISATNANPAHSGVYTVTVTGTNGCTAQTSTSVTWWEKPTVAASATNSPVCEGNTISLVGGVNWNGETPSSTPFQWLDADGNFFPGNNVQNPSYGPMDKELAGEWTFKATTNHGCFRTSTVQVDVLAAPYFTSGPVANSVAATGDNDPGMCSKTNVTYPPVGANALLYHLYNYDFDAEAVVDDDHEDYPVVLTYDFSSATTGSGSGDGNGSTFNVGTTNVVVTASTDISGCTSTLPFNVVINDAEAPVIWNPAHNRTAECDGNGNLAEFNDWLITNWGDADATDNCTDQATLDLYWLNDYQPSHWVHTCGNGQYVDVTFYVHDRAGNTSLPTTARFTIVDTQPPVITQTCGSVSALGCNPSNEAISIALGTATAMDVCQGALMPVPTDGLVVQTSYCGRSQTRTWNVSDACGNAASAVSCTVTWIEDTSTPEIELHGGVTDLGCNPSEADVLFYLGYATISSNAVVPSECIHTYLETFTDDSVHLSGCQWSRTRRFHAVNTCSGQDSWASFTTYWNLDHTPPVISCPGNITLPACVQSATWANATATDNCDATVAQTGGPASGSIFANNSSTVITYTATDICNNTSDCSFTVTRRAALTCNAGPNENTYFGYTADQTFTHTATATGGHAPYNYSWTFTRLTGSSLTPLPASTGGLRCNNITSSGDEIFNVIGTPLTYSNAYWTCSGVSTANYIAPAYPVVSGPNATQIQLLLLDTAQITLTVTDADGCSSTCSFIVFSEDARCWAGNSSIQKVTICHRNSNNTCATICVDESAVSAHLAHGDALGQCPRSGCPTGGKVDGESVNLDASYLTAYPNPFNEKTTIAFSVPKDGRAIIRIYDALGKEIGVLFDGMAKSGQMYKVEFDGSRYGEGMYFYSISSDEMNQTKRLNLIK